MTSIISKIVMNEMPTYNPSVPLKRFPPTLPYRAWTMPLLMPVRQCPTVRHHRPLKVRQAKGQVETLTPIFESKLQISYFGDSMISCLFNSS